MSAKFFLPILLLFCSQIIQSQPLTLEWVAEDSTYSPNSLEYDRVITDAEGNVYLCVPGVPTASGMSSSILIRKHNDAGDLLWQAKLDHEYADRFYDCAFGIDGSFIVAGRMDTPPFIFGDRAVVASYDPSTGAEKWKTYIFDTLTTNVRLNDIDMDSDGNIYAIGDYNEYMEWDSTRAFVAKISQATGEIAWTKVLPAVFTVSKVDCSGGNIWILGSYVGVSYDLYHAEMNPDGEITSEAFLPKESLDPVYFPTFFFYDKVGHLITFGSDIIKWEIDSIPVWQFDFGRGLPNTRGKAETAIADDSGNIYATGYLYDSLGAGHLTQTVKLSPEGDLLWATVKDFDEMAGWEGGVEMAASDHHVFICTHLYYEEAGENRDDYQIVLYSQSDGGIVYDTLIDGNVRDIPYYAHYGNGHFYLLGRSYIDFSSDPDDYRYKLYSFTADEPVSAEEEYSRVPGPNIFPNPSAGRLHVSQSEGGQQFDRLELYDQQGRLVLARRVLAMEQEFHLNGLPDGVYSVVLEGPGGQHTSKLVVSTAR